MTLAAAGGALGSLDTALNVAFPDLVDGLGITIAELQWVVVSYVLSYGGLLLAAGQWGDRFGHRRMLAIGAAGSGLAMVACGLAPSFRWFLVARVWQGIAAAMVMAAAPAMATLATDRDRRGRAVGVFQTATGIGAATGPLLGGVLVQFGGWPAVFWFRVPICLALFWLALVVDDAAQERRTGSDVGGAVLVTLTLSAGLLAVNSGRAFGLASPALWLTIAVTALFGFGYVRRSGRRQDPIVDLALFADRHFSAANLLTVLANGSMFVAWLLVPALLVSELGYSPIAGGLALAMSPIAMGLVAPIAGRWSDRRGGSGPVVAGLALEAVGLAWLAMSADDTSIVSISAAMAVLGTGLGLFGVPNMAMVMSALPQSEQGTAGGLSLVMRTAGIVTGVAASAALFDALEPARGFFDAYRLTAGASAVVAAAAAAAAMADGTARNPAPAVVGTPPSHRTHRTG